MKKVAMILIGLIAIYRLCSVSTGERMYGSEKRNVIIFNYENEKFSFDIVDIGDNELTGKQFREVVLNIPYQLPEELLPQLTTKELICYCCEHPGFLLCRTKSLPEFINNFNGFKELLTREDYFSEIVYLTLNEGRIRKKNEYNTGALILLSTKSLFESLNKQQKIEYFEVLKNVLSNDNIDFVKYEYFHGFLSDCFPQDAERWALHIWGGAGIPAVYDQEIMEEYFDDIIKELREE